jgi:uncharacterized protein (TIGR02145 family)
MKSLIKTGLAAILLLAISCKKESVPIAGKSSAPALATDINETGKYTSVYIHGQKWMATNLAVTHYRNGDPIPQVQNVGKWAGLTTGAWCWYNNDAATGAPYGRLYNWYAVHDSRCLAPAGWHIPSDAEWDTLQVRLGGDAGGKMKQTGTIEAGTGLWAAPNNGATNTTHFTALPAGLRNYNGLPEPQGFTEIGQFGGWWSSTEDDNDNAFEHNVRFNIGSVFRYSVFKTSGLSVRCIRD